MHTTKIDIKWCWSLLTHYIFMALPHCAESAILSSEHQQTTKLAQTASSGYVGNVSQIGRTKKKGNNRTKNLDSLPLPIGLLLNCFRIWGLGLSGTLWPGKGGTAWAVGAGHLLAGRCSDSIGPPRAGDALIVRVCGGSCPRAWRGAWDGR